MNDSLYQQLSRHQAKLAKLEQFKRSLDGRTRYLLSQCELVLVPGSRLEIYSPNGTITKYIMCQKMKHLHKQATLTLGCYVDLWWCKRTRCFSTIDW